jgi:hypothetical protein
MRRVSTTPCAVVDLDVIACSSDRNDMQADNALSDGDDVEVSSRAGTTTDQSIDAGTVTERLK